MSIKSSNIFRRVHRISSTVLLSALLALNAGAQNNAHAAFSYARCRDVTVVAHRGSTDASHTENTLRSTRLAIRNGARMVEGDLRLSRDGVWVMMHDSTVRRTTRGRGAIADMSVHQIKRLTTNDGVQGGVPTLYEELQLLQSHPNIQIQLEIKPSGVSSAKLKELLYRFNQFNVTDRVLITSFHGGNLKNVRDLNPNVKTALLSARSVTPRYAAQYGSTIIFKQSVMNATLVSQMHAAGIQVQTYTIDTDSEWRTAVARGADGIITDHVGSSVTRCSHAL